MYLTKKHLSRRTVLRGMGATVALPFLDAMVPARTVLARTAANGKTRLSCIEMVHGAAGSTVHGLAKDIGGDHFRSSAVFLTQAHPKQTEGSDVYVGTSMDQLYAQRFGQDTPIPSMQMCIENVDQAGGCAYGYACV